MSRNRGDRLDVFRHLRTVWEHGVLASNPQQDRYLQGFKRIMEESYS